MSRFEYIRPEGLYKGALPLSLAVKAGRLLFISGVPAFDKAGNLTVGDFSAQMTQVMTNISAILAAAGGGWDCVAKTTVLLMRSGDIGEMNRIYGGYFPSGKYPARTTMVVQSLPRPEFLLEIECQAILEVPDGAGYGRQLGPVIEST